MIIILLIINVQYLHLGVTFCLQNIYTSNKNCHKSFSDAWVKSASKCSAAMTWQDFLIRCFGFEQ